MRKLWLHIILLSVFGLRAQTYDFHNYNTKQGLAHSQVFTSFQDHLGNMWFGTNGGGASKFDAKTFKDFNTSTGAISDYIFSINQDKDENMYFGTYDGLQIKNRFLDLRFDSTKGLPHNTVYNVFIDKRGKVWLGTQKGVCYLDQDHKPVKFVGDQTLDQSAVWTIFEDKVGDLWFGTMQNGACHYTPGNDKKFEWYNNQNGLGSNFIRSFNENSKGQILIGTIAGLFTVNKDNRAEEVKIPGFTVTNLAFTGISKDKNQNLWFGTNEGVIKQNVFGAEIMSQKNGLCSDIILSTYIDNEGNLWFTSDGSGISKLASEAMVNYGERDGLPGEYINCICQAKNGSYWIGVRNNGLVCMNGKKLTNYRVNNKDFKHNLADNNVNCLSEDEKGNLWVGTMSGLSIFNGKTFTNYLTNDPLYRTVYSMYHTKDGRHYIGTTNGLVQFENGKLTPIQVVNNVKIEAELAIYGITEDKQGNIWMATAAYGIIRYDGKSVEVYNKANGFTDKSAYNITCDASGAMWIGTESGIFYYNNGKFKQISEKDGLVSNQVYFLLFDSKDRIWIGTNKGLDAFKVSDYLSSGKLNKTFGKLEGLNNLECNFNASIKDSEGKLWFGTVKGITVFNPRYEKINYHEPTCALTDIKIFFEKTDLSQFSKGLDSLSGLPHDLELPYAKNHVTFDYIGISQTDPNKVQYEFKLEGVDDDWVPPTNKTEVTYSSLQPGDYTFYLKAMNNDGIWNKEPLTFRFKVLPPWYRTWWFYTLCAVTAFVIIYSWNSYRTRKLREDKLKLEKEVQLRTKELREEKEKVEIINKEVIEQKAVIEHKNHEITDSIKYAKNIQEALLPAINGLQKDFPDSFVLYMPKDIVSGDFYWFNKREGKNYFAAVDCTGHGVPGAFMSIVGNSLLTEIISEQKVYQPAEILNNLHVGVKAALNQNKGEQERRDGMDLALCAIDKEKLLLEYAGANRPLWIYRKTQKETAEIIKPDKFPIGGMEFDFEEKRRFTPHTLQLEKGDCVYIFSDGYADQFGGPKGKKFMVANLQRALAEISTKSMKEQYDHLYKIFTDWRGQYEQVDDVLVIGVRV